MGVFPIDVDIGVCNNIGVSGSDLSSASECPVSGGLVFSGRFRRSAFAWLSLLLPLVGILCRALL